MNTPEAAVEAVAKAIQQRPGNEPIGPWEKLSEGAQEPFLNDAVAAIDAYNEAMGMEIERRGHYEPDNRETGWRTTSYRLRSRWLPTEEKT